MEAEEFKRMWDIEHYGPLITFNQGDLENINIQERDREWLVNVGLPEMPAPYLEFVSSKGRLVSLSTKLNMANCYVDYTYLGSTASGEPVCIKNGTEVVLISEMNSCKEVFVNSSVTQLASCLLFFSEMISEAIKINGEDAFIDNAIPSHLISITMKKMKEIDGAAFFDSSFWKAEFETLVE